MMHNDVHTVLPLTDEDIVAEVKDPEDAPDEEPDDDPEPAPPKETPIQTFTQFMQTVEHMRTYLEVNHLDAVHLDALEQQVLATAANRAASCRFVHRCTEKMLKRLLLRSLRLQAPLHPKNGPQHPLQDPIT